MRKSIIIKQKFNKVLRKTSHEQCIITNAKFTIFIHISIIFNIKSILVTAAAFRSLSDLSHIALTSCLSLLTLIKSVAFIVPLSLSRDDVESSCVSHRK